MLTVKCPFCETNTHGDNDKAEHPVCERVFLKKSAAWALIGEDKKPDETIHVFRNPSANMLIGGDWSREDIKELIENCEYIEMTDQKGEARRMGHGLAVMSNGWHYFIETPESNLKAFEECFLNGNN